MHVKCLFPGCTDPGGRLRKGDSLPQRALRRAKELTARPAAASSARISVSVCSPLEGCPAYEKQKVTEDFRASQKLPCDPEALPCAPSRAGKGIGTQRAPAQISSSGCLRASPSVMYFRSSFRRGSWADLLPVSSMDNVVPCECSAFCFGVAACLWLACAAPRKRAVRAKSSGPAGWFPFPGPARALRACLCSLCSEVFKLCHLFLFTLKPFIFSVAFIPGLDLETLGRA